MMPKHNPVVTFEALGTNWWVSGDAVADKKASITNTVRQIDERWSRFRADSLVSKMRSQPGKYPITDDEYGLLSFYRELYTISDGKVTPFIGSALEDLGYDANYTLREKSKHRYQSMNWDDVIELTDELLTIKQPILLDVGAAGKGYAVDQTAAQLSGDYIIDASGDLRVSGTNVIGLQHPTDSSKVIGDITLTNAAICASSIYVRSWGGLHHVLDGQTGLPTTHVVATWAIADTAMKADGLATALFFVDPDKLKSLGLMDYCIIYADGAMKLPATTKIEMYVAA